MNLCYSFLLLLLVLSGFSESLQHAKPPDFLHTTRVVCDSAQLGVLAPVLPQNEVYRITPPLNEVYKPTPPLNEVYKTTPPHNEVYKTILAQNKTLTLTEVLNLTSSGVFNSFLPLNGVLKIVTPNDQLFNNVKTTVKIMLNLGVKSPKHLISILIYGGEKLSWTIRILLECFQHVLKMYTWSLSENLTSVQFKCKLTALFLKQCFFKKHDFAVCLHKLYYGYQNLCIQHLGVFSNGQNVSQTQIKVWFKKSNQFQFYGGGKSLVFASDELFPYTLTALREQQYQFIQCVKKDNKQNNVLDGEIFCSVPLNILAPKLTLAAAKKLAILHDMYMPSKIPLKNAQILLEEHKCQTCDDLLSVFKPYKVPSNAERQKTWYQENAEKRAEYDKYRCSKSEYQESHKRSRQKYNFSKKIVKFPPFPPSTELCENIVSDFCADTSPEVFEETGCAICGKLTPICETDELSEVENVNLLKVDGVTRKARCKNTDPVRELRGPILAPGCNRVCPTCVESLNKEKMPILALANGLWVGEIPDELQDLTYAEQLLIARVRHNRCIVKVSSGMSKMRANAISFSNPMPKIYSILPPPIEEMDEVLAFIYTGPCKPTKADFQRTPLLVRHLKVSKAFYTG